MIYLVLSAPVLALVGAAVALATGHNPKQCSMLSALFAVLVAGFGLIPCLNVLAGHPDLTFSAPWNMPFGSLSLHLDALSAFFLLPILGLGALTAVYGSHYLLHSHQNKNIGPAWFCFHILFASMIVVVLAANGLLFLMAWELTVLSSFFLVVLDHDQESSREAGWIYLTASHVGVGFLLVLFLVAARETGSLDFDTFSKLAQLSPAAKGMLFLLALVGFGTKAGFIPLHVWLPEAHPAAPSHVSALMSGVMIKTGIYGLVRTLFFLGFPSPWWGWVLLISGLISGILGVLFANAQPDLKRLLAYSSVENIGIIAMGLGLGLLGMSLGNPAIAAIGFAGGLLHVLNHAVFKALLFLGAGAVLEQTGTRNMDRLGGLLKRMPWTGTSFLVGCVSISGLPPFNGFISEFLIYFAALLAVLDGSISLVAPGLIVIVGLSLIGGLAAACFAKAFSIVFLGNPRGKKASEAGEVELPMKVPMVILAILCGLISLASPLLLGMLSRVIGGHPEFLTGPDIANVFDQVYRPLFAITVSSAILVALLGLVLVLRSRLLANRKVEETVTWDCGYAQPSVTMQYTGSSFAQPLTELFQPFLRSKSHVSGIEGYFPKKGSFITQTTDPFQETLFKPAIRFIVALLHRLTWLQNGIVQAYVLYITMTLIVLLVLGLM